MKSPDLTDEEQRHVQLALRFLHARAGRWDSIAKALGFRKDSLAYVACGREPVSARMAFRVARLAKVGIDALLSGEFPPAGTCPNCGHCPEKAVPKARTH